MNVNWNWCCAACRKSMWTIGNAIPSTDITIVTANKLFGSGRWVTQDAFKSMVRTGILTNFFLLQLRTKVCSRIRQREAHPVAAIRHRNMSGAGWWICREYPIHSFMKQSIKSISDLFAGTDGLEWSTTLLHREGGQRNMAAPIAHMLQSLGFAAIQKLRPTGGKAQLCHRGNRRFRTRIESVTSDSFHLQLLL